MKVVLIRHGETQGNLQKRYIGITDESLCSKGKENIEELAEKYPRAGSLFVSPMKRCIETAKIIYPNQNYEICQDLRECDFGEFENKNYLELTNHEKYKKWIASNGIMPFPGGENPQDFKRRCIAEFEKRLRQIKEGDVSFVIHGGTIMSILEAYVVPSKTFYQWHLKNGEAYICKLSTNKKSLRLLGKVESEKNVTNKDFLG